MAKPETLALIIDCGSQVTALIARRLREMGVYCEIHPVQKIDAAFLEKTRPQAMIVSGGPASLISGEAPRLDGAVLAAGVPVLGICYGQQAMVAALGGRVDTEGAGEFGPACVRAAAGAPESPLLRSWFADSVEEPVWMSHGDRVTELPAGFVVLAQSEASPFAIIADEERKLYGVQFHPEMVHTPGGSRLLRNFAIDIAGMAGDWSMASYRREAIESIRAQVGQARVICGLSGGVDSAVTAVLIHEAIGDQLTCIFVDTGLMRQGEAEQVVGLFRESYNIPLVPVEAGDDFFARLQGVTDPEDKRKRIGRRFVEIFEAEADKIGGAEFLAQGTLYPDVIESVSPDGGPSAAIKSHHNVGGLPERMNLRLLEPLRRLFKDEVRELGRELGLPEAFVGRHPFPGPGLAIRIPGEVTRERAEILRKADAVYLDEIRKAGLYDEIWQAFAVLLPVCSVGVMGDGRSYEQVLALRAVTSSDGMTADYYPFSHEFLRRVSARLVNEVRGINRVVYDVTSKPPGTIEWE